MEQFTMTGKIPNRMPETVEEVREMMNVKEITEFKTKVTVLSTALKGKEINGIFFEDVAKYQKIFFDYLTQEKAKL